jgi:hypothetical protein
MKKVFNASLIAASLGLAFAANAADITIDNKLTTTVESVASGDAAGAAAYTAVITFFNRQELAAGDVVTFTFPVGTVIGGATTTVGAGVGTFEAAVIADSGSATKNPTIKLTVATGSPVLNNSKTELNLTGFLPKAGNAVYSAKDGFSGAAKDTTGQNSVSLTTVVNQETASVSKLLDGYVDRVARDEVVVGKGNLVAEVSVARPVVASASTIVATVATENLVLTGDFTDLASVNAAICTSGAKPSFTTTAAGGPAAACTTGGPLISVAAAFSCSDPLAVPACRDTATINTATLSAAFATPTGGTGVAGAYSIFFTPTDGDDIPLTTYKATRNVTYTAVAPVVTNPAYKYFENSNFGEMQLDASVVNVPYLPVGYAHLAPVVEITNLGSTDAEVIVEAVGKTGIKYGPVTLSKTAKKQALTSIFESDLAAVFNLPKGSNEKLSVTFIVDADADVISLAPYYTNSNVGSVINVVNDQYKGK